MHNAVEILKNHKLLQLQEKEASWMHVSSQFKLMADFQESVFVFKIISSVCFATVISNNFVNDIDCQWKRK